MDKKKILRATLWGNSFWQINKKLAKEIWLLETILLQDLIDKYFYFEEREMLKILDWLEYFFNTQENIENDTTISAYQQRKAFDKLKKIGILSIKKIWIPARNHFSIDFTIVIKILTTCSKETWQQQTKKLTYINNNKYNKNKDNNNITKSNDFDLKILEQKIDLGNVENYNIKIPENGIQQIKAWRVDINELIEFLKEQAWILWVAYQSEKDRMFAKHILDAKEFGNFAEKIWLSRAEFALRIMIASEKIWFWKWVCAWPKMIYQNCAEVFNKTKQMSEKKSNIGYL